MVPDPAPETSSASVQHAANMVCTCCSSQLGVLMGAACCRSRTEAELGLIKDFSGLPDPSSVPVTRIEVLDFVADAFVGEAVNRATLLRTAGAADARPELLRLLEQLPEFEVTELDQLWTVLDVPEDLSGIDET
ncbi:hypothetical protein ACQPZQ_17255 [Pseudonocardia sp. CA-142604]|uniref:hypothetical protein n=1 Tax=Pseudonocardia sp. CA-142604 TaxID=3240024 RepID=UPI003D8AE2E5